MSAVLRVLLPVPMLLGGVAVLFWGWQSDRLVIAIAAALLLESSRFAAMRFELGVAQVARAFDIGLALLIVVAALLAVRGNVQDAILTTGGWLPVALLPFMLAHRFSGNEGFDLRALWWRTQRSETPSMTPILIDPAWIYASLCLLSTSLVAERTPLFYLCAAAIGCWMLYPVRSRRVPLIAWLLVVLCTAGLGYAGQLGLSGLQKFIVRTTMELLTDGETNASRKSTAIGEIGELKFSGAILVRVLPEAGEAPPRYLHRASYDRYANGTWFARNAPMQPVARLRSEAAGVSRDDSWLLDPSAKGGRRMTVVANATGEQSVLPLPLGTSVLRGESMLAVQHNRLGTVEVISNAAVMRVDTSYDGESADVESFNEQDLSVFKRDRPYLEKWLASAGLHEQPPAELARALVARFQRDFSYSLYQSEDAAGELPIRTFLERTRAGHCEYFAAATVLLLRAAGIPARYATGYVIDEFSPWEDSYVVRARHAHAWARVFIEGRWQNLDTTPSTWIAAEEEQGSMLQPLFDLVALAIYRFRAWRHSGGGLVLLPVVFVLLAVVLFVVRRLRRRRTVRAALAERDALVVRPVRGTDSEFYRIVKHMQAEGHPLKPNEPVALWVQRISGQLTGSVREEFEALAVLHHRHRFDPRGLDPTARERLARGVAQWLNGYAGS